MSRKVTTAPMTSSLRTIGWLQYSAGKRRAVGAPQHLVVDVRAARDGASPRRSATAPADTACRPAGCDESAGASACRSAPPASRSRAAARTRRCRRCRRRSDRCRRSLRRSNRAAAGSALRARRSPARARTSCVMSREIAETPTIAFGRVEDRREGHRHVDRRCRPCAGASSRAARPARPSRTCAQDAHRSPSLRSGRMTGS